MVSYYSAENASQQIVALLIWIGNGIFWGVLIIAGTISRTRTYIVYSDIPPPQGADTGAGRAFADNWAPSERANTRGR
jgi:hypothetical protein